MSMHSLSYQEAFSHGKEVLKKAQIDHADLDAWYLFEHVTKMSRMDLLLSGEEGMDVTLYETYLELLKKRQEHIPLQYIIGYQEFMGLDFIVNEHVLIPRQDTEILVEEVSNVCDGKTVLDMCTGSGCIIISLAKRTKLLKATAVDISPKALEVAMLNANKNEVDVSFIESDMFTSVSGTYDIIVSNPPYIKTKVIEELMQEVRDYEPRGALDGAKDGLKFYRMIAKNSGKYLNKSGHLFLEIGHDQRGEVTSLLAEEGFLNIRVVKDYAGLDRVLCATWQQ